MRTKQEIKTQIEGLRLLRTGMPEHSLFGDNNWKAIDTQILILQQEILFENYKFQGDFIDGEAFVAQLWLEGKHEKNLFEYK